jgi:hypothetical protein
MSQIRLFQTASQVSPAAATSAAGPVDLGTWSIYTGAVVFTVIDDLNVGAAGYPQPVDLAIDLETLSIPAIAPTLLEHYGPIGHWRELRLEAGAVVGRLYVYRDDSAECDMLERAAEVRIAAEQGHPWQASIGAGPGPGGGFELSTGPVQVNGQTIAPRPGVPLYILRNGLMEEASVVLFGADSATGRVAAAKTHSHPRSTPGEHPMSDHQGALGRLVARFGADRKAAIAVRLMEGAPPETIDDEETATLKAALAEAAAKLEQANAELATLKAQFEDLAPKPAEDERAPRGSEAAKLGKPATIRAAMVHLHNTEGLTGRAALAAARKRWPNLPA